MTEWASKTCPAGTWFIDWSPSICCFNLFMDNSVSGNSWTGVKKESVELLVYLSRGSGKPMHQINNTPTLVWQSAQIAHAISKQAMKIPLISLMHLKFTRFRNKDKSQTLSSNYVMSFCSDSANIENVSQQPTSFGSIVVTNVALILQKINIDLQLHL